jgi:putative endonuclease
MAEHNILGKNGENKAETYLISKGFKILERNWHSSHREIDLIAEDKGWLVFVEVKTRMSNHIAHPVEAVHGKKIHYLIQAANHFIHLKGIDLPVRFDVVSIIFDKNTWEIEHFEDAFLPPYR